MDATDATFDIWDASSRDLAGFQWRVALVSRKVPSNWIKSMTSRLGLHRYLCYQDWQEPPHVRSPRAPLVTLTCSRYSSAEDEDLICGSKPASVEDAFEQASSLSRRDAVVLLMQSGTHSFVSGKCLTNDR